VKSNVTLKEESQRPIAWPNYRRCSSPARPCRHKIYLCSCDYLMQPLDALTDREVAEIHLRTGTISPSPGTSWRTLRSMLGRQEYRNLLFQVSRQWPDMLDSPDVARERQALIAIFDRAVENPKIKAAMAAERAAQDATLRDECLSFDDGPERERLRRYHLSFHRAP
jgi:hypothetical protein